MRELFDTAMRAAAMPLDEVVGLFASPLHEVRMGAVCILDFRAKAPRVDGAERERLYRIYLDHHDRITTWDVVDRAAPSVVGGYLAGGPPSRCTHSPAPRPAAPADGDHRGAVLRPARQRRRLPGGVRGGGGTGPGSPDLRPVPRDRTGSRARRNPSVGLSPSFEVRRLRRPEDDQNHCPRPDGRAVKGERKWVCWSSSPASSARFSACSVSAESTNSGPCPASSRAGVLLCGMVNSPRQPHRLLVPRPNQVGRCATRSRWSSPAHATCPSGRSSTAGASSSSLTSTTWSTRSAQPATES